MAFYSYVQNAKTNNASSEMSRLSLLLDNDCIFV